MKQTKNFSWARLVRVTVAMMVLMSLLLLCGCGKKNKEEENAGEKNGVEMNISVSLGDDVLNLLSAALADSGLNLDMDWLEEIGIKLLMSNDGDLMEMVLGASLNGQQIVSAEAILDMAGEMMYLALPELSKKYIGTALDMPDMGEVNASLQAMMGQMAQMADKLPSEEEMTALVSKYLDVVLDALSDPATGSETLSYGGVSQNVTATTYTIRASDALNVAEQVLKTAQNDAELEKILDNLSSASAEMAGEQVDLHQELMNMIPEALEEIQAEKEGLTEENDTVGLSFTSYTDGETPVGLKVIAYGQIMHEEYESVTGEYIESETEEFESTSYLYNLRSGDNTAFVIELDMGDVYRLAGTGTNKSGIANGTYALSFERQGDVMEIMDIQVKDFDTNALNEGNMKGTLRLIPSEALMENSMGIAGIIANPVVELGLDMNADAANIAVKLMNGNKLFVGMNISVKPVATGAIDVPSKYIDTATDDPTEYLMSIDFDDVLDNLKKADVPKDLRDMLEMVLDQLGI